MKKDDNFISLTREQENELFEQLKNAHTNTEQVQTLIIAQYQGLVKKIAGRYISRDIPYEDLEQEGYCGLLKAIKKFNPSRGNRFSTYAYPVIEGEIRNAFKKKKQSVVTCTIDFENIADTNEKEHNQDIEVIHQFLLSLDTIERKIINLRYDVDGRVRSEAGIASELGLGRERVRQILTRVQCCLLKSCNPQSFRTFRYFNNLGSIRLESPVYREFIEKIVRKILICSKNSYAQFYRELIFFTHFFDPIFDLPGEFHSGWECRATDYRDTVLTALVTSRSRKSIDQIPGFLYHAGLYIIIDVFRKLAGIAGVRKPFQSLLVHIYWQDVFYKRIYKPLYSMAGDAAGGLQRAFLKFYFRHHNIIYYPRAFDRPENNSTLVMKHSLLLSICKDSILQEQNNNNAYDKYNLSVLFGPLPASLDSVLNTILDQVFKNRLSELEKKDIFALVFYFKRIRPYLVCSGQEFRDQEQAAEVITTNYINQFVEKQTMYRLGYQARLREILISTLEKHCTEVLDPDAWQKIRETYPDFITLIKQRIYREKKKDKNTGEELVYDKKQLVYGKYRNGLIKLLNFLNRNGGLNLLQLESFQALEKAGIDYPAGYLSGERERKAGE